VCNILECYCCFFLFLSLRHQHKQIYFQIPPRLYQFGYSISHGCTKRPFNTKWLFPAIGNDGNIWEQKEEPDIPNLLANLKKEGKY